MIKLLLLLIIICGTLNVSAYSPDRMKLSQREYVRYIKPQISNLISDFFQFLRYENNDLNALKNIYRTIEMIELSEIEIEKACKNSPFNDTCPSAINDLRQRTIELDVHLFKIINNLVQDKTPNNILLTDSAMSIRQLLFMNRLITNNAELIALIDQNHTTSLTYFSKINESLLGIKHLTSQNSIFYTELLINPIELDRQEDYRDLIVSFINKLKLLVLHKDDTDAFKRELENLNFVFNNFHSKLSKGNLKISKLELNVLKTMHFRWNSILKIILKK